MDVLLFKKVNNIYIVTLKPNPNSENTREEKIKDRIPSKDLLDIQDNLSLLAQIICGIENPNKKAENKIIPDQNVSVYGYEKKETATGEWHIYLKLNRKYKNGTVSFSTPKIVEKANQYGVEEEIFSTVALLDDEVIAFYEGTKFESEDQELPFERD